MIQSVLLLKVGGRGSKKVKKQNKKKRKKRKGCKVGAVGYKAAAARDTNEKKKSMKYSETSDGRAGLPPQEVAKNSRVCL